MILRPSIVFGPEDAFFNRFAAMARIMPDAAAGRRRPHQIPSWYSPGTLRKRSRFGRKQAGAEKPRNWAARRWQLSANSWSTFGHHRAFAHARACAVLACKLNSIPGILPNPPLTPGQVDMLRVDNVVSEASIREGLTLPGLGIPHPRPMKRSCQVTCGVSARPDIVPHRPFRVAR